MSAYRPPLRNARKWCNGGVRAHHQGPETTRHSRTSTPPPAPAAKCRPLWQTDRRRETFLVAPSSLL